jgi:hypothetical protein
MGPFKDLNEAKDLIPVLVFLLPGFVSAGIVALLVIRKPAEPFSRVIEAFIFTMLNLALFTVLKSLVTRIPGLKLNNHDFFTSGNLLIMTACAVLVGIVWSYEANNQFIFGILRKLKITSKTTKPSVWIDVLSETEVYVVVHLKDGRRVYGWPLRYSDDVSERAIFLEQATWLTDEGGALNDPPISIFLDKESEIAFVEFVTDSRPAQSVADVSDVRQNGDSRSTEANGMVWPILIVLFLVGGIGYILRRNKRDG